MSITSYCTSTEVTQILSANGLLRRADDNEDGTEDTLVVAAFIEKASSIMNKYLFKRYTAAVIAASTWAKWCCASIASYLMATRHGNVSPQSLKDERDDYIQMLKDMEAGVESLPADDGVATEAYDNSMSVTNYTIDGRFHRSKVRRVPEISTGGPQLPGLEQHNAVSRDLDLE